MFGRVCAEGEDAYYTRRNDVLTPLRDYADAAFNVMLPFYGVKTSAERQRLIENGQVHQLAKVLQEYDWPKLADRMQAFDERRASAAEG